MWNIFVYSYFQMEAISSVFDDDKHVNLRLFFGLISHSKRSSTYINFSYALFLHLIVKAQWIRYLLLNKKNHYCLLCVCRSSGVWLIQAGLAWTTQLQVAGLAAHGFSVPLWASWAILLLSPSSSSWARVSETSSSYCNDKSANEHLENCISPHITLAKINHIIKPKVKNRIAKSHDKEYRYWEG